MKYVYSFSEGNSELSKLLGWKGARLSELTNLGIPVPQGFIITTDACRQYYNNNKQITQELQDEINIYIDNLEKTTGKKVGNIDNPLFVSVRGSEGINLIDLSDTVLNIGINESTAKGISSVYNNRFSLEIYVNFFISYMHSILHEDYIHEFEDINGELVSAYYGINNKSYDNFSNEAMMEFVLKSKQFYKSKYDMEFPEDPKLHLLEVIKAAFNSWKCKRGEVFRRLNNLEDNKDMAVIVQTMVFGNAASNSGVGYYYTRDPKTGENKLFLKFNENTQRDDYPSFYEIYYHENERHKLSNKCVDDLISAGKLIEKHFKSSQFVEFVVEKDIPYVLMSRTAKRCVDTEAELNMAVDFVNEGIITKEEAVSKISKFKFMELSLPAFDKESSSSAVEISTGIPGSKGVAHGKAYFTEESVREHTNLGEKVIFITRGLGLCTTEKEEKMINDIEGIITSCGMTADETILARNTDTPCVVLNREELSIDWENNSCVLNGYTIKEGDTISIDGTNGRIYTGIQRIVRREMAGNYGTFVEWVQQVEKLPN